MKRGAGGRGGGVQLVVVQGCVEVRLQLGYYHCLTCALPVRVVGWRAGCARQFCVNEVWWAIQNGSKAHWTVQNRIRSSSTHLNFYTQFPDTSAIYSYSDDQVCSSMMV